MGESGSLRCAECDGPSGRRAEGWAAFLKDEVHGEEPAVAVFCPACAGARFGWVSKRERSTTGMDDQAGD